MTATGARPASGGPTHVSGPADGPAVLLYGDGTCPRCVQAIVVLRAAPIRLTWRHLVLRARGPRPRAVAAALEAAGQQGAFWPLLDAIVAAPGRTEDPDLWGHARRLGLDLEQFVADQRSVSTAARIADDLAAALDAGAAGTPAIVVDGRVDHGVPDAAWVDTLLAAERRRT